jgi:hypothetical protein
VLPGRPVPLIDTPLDVRQGHLHVPEKPGLGLEINLDYLRAHVDDGRGAQASWPQALSWALTFWSIASPTARAVTSPAHRRFNSSLTITSRSGQRPW